MCPAVALHPPERPPTPVLAPLPRGPPARSSPAAAPAPQKQAEGSLLVSHPNSFCCHRFLPGSPLQPPLTLPCAGILPGAHGGWTFPLGQERVTVGPGRPQARGRTPSPGARTVSSHGRPEVEAASPPNGLSSEDGGCGRPSPSHGLQDGGLLCSGAGVGGKPPWAPSLTPARPWLSGRDLSCHCLGLFGSHGLSFR